MRSGLPTKTERKSISIAMQLVKALERLEAFEDDPEMIINDAEVLSNHSTKGVKDSISAIREHYISEKS